MATGQAKVEFDLYIAGLLKVSKEIEDRIAVLERKEKVWEARLKENADKVCCVLTNMKPDEDQ